MQGYYSELTNSEVVINKFLECQRKNFEKGFQLKLSEKGLFFGEKIRDKGVAFILWGQA